MKNLRNIFALCCIYFFVATTLNAQQYYIRLADASGINTDPYQAELEAAAKKLVLAMPKEVQDSFKVFDLGCYLHQEKTDSTYKGFFNLAKVKAASMSKYYLLIGKKCGTETIFKDFEVVIELPVTGRFACADNSQANWRTTLKDAIKKNLIETAKNESFDKSIVKSLNDIKPLLSTVICTEPLGDLAEGFEFYKGDGGRNGDDETNITITTKSGLYYKLEFNKPVKLKEESFGSVILYQDKQYLFFHTSKTHEFSNLYLLDNNLLNILEHKKLADGGYSSDDFTPLIKLQRYEVDKSNWQVKLVSFGSYNAITNKIKDDLLKYNNQLNRKQVFELFDKLNQIPSSKSNVDNGIILALTDANNPCGKAWFAVNDFKAIDPACLDFLLTVITNQVNNAIAKKNQFLAWLDAPVVNKDEDVEKNMFKLINDEEVYYTFTANERLRALFYIASKDNITSVSPKDIPEFFEWQANQLLKLTPQNQIDNLLDELKVWPTKIKLNDQSIKLDYKFSILFALDDGIDDIEVPGTGYFYDDNYGTFTDILIKLILGRSDIRARKEKYQANALERNIYWKLPSDKKYIGYRQAQTSQLTETLSFGFEKLHLSQVCVDIDPDPKIKIVECSENLTKLPDPNNLLLDDPYDLIGIWSPDFSNEKDADNDKIEKHILVPAFLLHKLITKEATANTVHKVHITLAALMVISSSGTLSGLAAEALAEEEISLLAWRFHSLELANGIGNIALHSMELNDIPVNESFKLLVEVSDLAVGLGFSYQLVNGTYKVVDKGVVLTKGGVDAIKKFVSTVDMNYTYLRLKVLSTSANTAAKQAALKSLTQIRALAKYAREYLLKKSYSFDPQIVFINKISTTEAGVLKYPNLREFFYANIPGNLRSIFIENFTTVPDDVLSLLNKDVSLIEEWKGLATVAEREAFVAALKGAANDIYAHLMPNTFFENSNSLALTYDQFGKLSKSIRGEIYNYYRQSKWDKIEEIFKLNKINGGWPPTNGGFKIVNGVIIKAGEKFDRFQDWFKLGADSKPILGGSFTSPIINNKPFTYAQRALRLSENSNALYYEVEILKDLPITGELADVIPWFNQPGLGKQLMFKFQPKGGKYSDFKSLIDEGFIKITIKSSPNGQYSNWVGSIFQK